MLAALRPLGRADVPHRLGRRARRSPTCATSSSRHLQRLSLGYYERNRAGAIISRITNDVEALDQLVTDGVTSLVQNTLAAASARRSFSSSSTGGSRSRRSIVLPLMALATALVPHRARTAPTGSVRERLGLVTATLAEDIAGMRVVQSFTREPAQPDGVPRRQRRATARPTTRPSILNGIYFPAVDLLASVATAIVFGYGGWLVVRRRA